MIDLINAMPDDLRLYILPIIRLLAVVFGWSVFEDGSIIP